jgi:hypothetical protein
MSARDLDTLMSLYGDKVDYLDKGKVNSDVVRKELQAYFDKWPAIKWEVKGVIQSRLVGQSNYNVNFAVAFEVSNPATKRRVAGLATETEMLAPDASGNKKIISQHEKITTSHLSDSKPSKTREREKVYRGQPVGSALGLPNIPWPNCSTPTASRQLSMSSTRQFAATRAGSGSSHSICERRSAPPRGSGGGRFRSLLLKAVKDFLNDARDRARSRRRGGGAKFISWDEWIAEAPSHLMPPITAENGWPAEKVRCALGGDCCRAGASPSPGRMRRTQTASGV